MLTLLECTVQVQLVAQADLTVLIRLLGGLHDAEKAINAAAVSKKAGQLADGRSIVTIWAPSSAPVRHFKLE